MTRYFTRHIPKAPRADYWEDEPFRPHLIVSDHEAADTGLVDERGDAIMRAPNPVGFVWDDE